MGNMAALLQQLARPSSSGTNESHDDNDPDDELPPAKKIRKDSEFCESDSVSIHTDDDDDHSLDGRKKALLEESQQPDDEDERDDGDEAFLDALAESLDYTDAVKATSHATIFDIPMRPLREDQKHRHRFTRSRRSATPIMVFFL